MLTIDRTDSSETGPTGGPRPGPVHIGHQVLRFAVIGALSTLAYLLLYVLLRHLMSAQPANAIALLATAVANTAANRRLTFGVSGRDSAARHQLQGLVVFAIGLGVTSGSLALLHAASATPPRMLEVSVLVGANAVATVLRFIVLRLWVFDSSSVRTSPAR